MTESKLYTYRVVVKPWYPSYSVERADASSIEFNDVKWETVSNGASTREVIKRLLIAEIEKMFPDQS